MHKIQVNIENYATHQSTTKATKSQPITKTQTTSNHQKVAKMKKDDKVAVFTSPKDFLFCTLGPPLAIFTREIKMRYNKVNSRKTKPKRGKPFANRKKI